MMGVRIPLSYVHGFSFSSPEGKAHGVLTPELFFVAIAGRHPEMGDNFFEEFLPTRRAGGKDDIETGFILFLHGVSL